MTKTKSSMDVQESLEFIVTHMATKSDLADMPTKSDIADMATKRDVADMATRNDVREIVREELKDIRVELKDIRKQLEILEERSQNHAGFSKEVDHVLQRVIAIEKHLGIKNKILT